MHIKINDRISGVKESATLAINERAMALREQGKTIFHFGFGQSPFPVHPLIVDALIANSHRKAYLPTLGLPELRANLATYYSNRGYAWEPQHIVVGPGSKELLFDLFYLLSGVLLLPVPSWVSYYPQAHLVGKDVVPVASN
ncbi:MAG: aminotransferase class I/II-fold pyridoxal phosphate-dependent enzyme, partial [Gammaproteobacteria bacterium]|nr:aminotransferase class I/II-fold pyridoxal phosphate-dependent enzyme [Gammaproteobacteria bacterium]